MFAASRRIYLYWLLLLVPALAVGTGALVLLRRERLRLDERGAEALKARQETAAARARLTVESIELLIGDVETGLLDTLAAEPAEGLDEFLNRWEKENPLVRTTFRSTPEGRVTRPDQRNANEEGRGFLRRFSRQFGTRPPWVVVSPTATVSVPVEPSKRQEADSAKAKDAPSSVVQAAPSPRREAEEVAKPTEPPPGRQQAEPEARKEIDKNVAQTQQARRDVQQLVKAPIYSNAITNNGQVNNGQIASNSVVPSSASSFRSFGPTPKLADAAAEQVAKAETDTRSPTIAGIIQAPPASSGTREAANQRGSFDSSSSRARISSPPAGAAAPQPPVIKVQTAGAPVTVAKDAGASPRAGAALDDKMVAAERTAADSVASRFSQKADDAPAPALIAVNLKPQTEVAAVVPTPTAVPRETAFTVERRGWIPAHIDGRLRLAGWVQLAGSGEIRGLEIDLAALVSRMGGTLPAGTGPDEGYALRDDQGRAQHFVGRVLAGAAPTSRVPLAAALLPGWEVVSFLTLDSEAYASDPGSFWLNALLIGIFVAAILAGGSLLLWQARRSEAEAAQKTSFVANVSHEFKTPLTTIRLYSELLEQGRVRDAEQGNDYLRTIGRETQRLARLVNNALDFSRLEQGKKKFALESLDLTAELARLLDTHAPRVAEAGLKLNRDLPASALTLAADRDAIEQIVLNLIDNACKYADGGEVVLVSLAPRAGTGAEIRVADRGPGVPAEHRERIFEKFHRVDDALTAEKSGAGLGLSIARQLARGLGGELRYAPRAGGGAEFILELP